VKPLIPPAGCALLVTSRQRFTLPGLQAKNLDVLPPREAKELLLRIAPRIDGEAEAIAKLCGYLPLALRLAGTALAERVDLEPADYRKRLADEKNRPKLLAAGNESVEGSINLSYSFLDSETKKRWRMLAVFPDTLDAPAAAAVWEMDGDAAQDTLSRLTQYSMLEWNDTAKRYRLHDLMRHFARERLQPSERHRAGLRHSTYYLAVLDSADKLYLEGGESLMRGLTLFDLEWGNIQTGQAWAADHAPAQDEAARVCSSYPDAGVYCLALRQHPREQIRWLEAALAAARRLKDRQSEAYRLGNLGIAYKNLGDPRRAIGYHEQALVIEREIGDRNGEGNALGNLGVAYDILADYRRAIEYYEKALAIVRAIGDRRGEAQALGNLGIAYKNLGDNRRAIERQEEALVIDREIGDRRGEAADLANLGTACSVLGDYPRAIDHYSQALTIDREIGDRRGEGQALGNLGLAYYSLGDHRRAIEHHEQALAIDREIGDRHGEGNALGNLGNAYADLGETRRAIEYYGQQLAITREIGDRRGEGNALWNMSLAFDELGERQKAIERAEAALNILEEIENPNTEKVRKQLEQWRKS
jgi:tetratricopeptide (TPR) repeat protein